MGAGRGSADYAPPPAASRLGFPPGRAASSVDPPAAAIARPGVAVGNPLDPLPGHPFRRAARRSVMSHRARNLLLAGLVALGSTAIALVTTTNAVADTQICEQFGSTTIGGKYVVQNNRWGSS